MTIEVRFSDQQRRSIGTVDDGSRCVRKKKRCCRKYCSTRKRSNPTSAVWFPLQRLYLSCLDVFKGAGTVPSPADVQKLRRILDGMMPEDVGLSTNLQLFKPKTPVGVTPKVTYTSIYHCENFSLCMFFLPANAVIPLHNHPDMTVFSKLLLGEVHIKAYDLVRPDDANIDSSCPSHVKLATLKADGIFTAPCDTSVLYPTSGGNIHAFTAITPCAILDVIGPPYSKKDGRDCSYYKDIPYTALSYGEMNTSEEESKRYWWLEEIEVPKESEMDGIEYLGPQIIEISS